MVRLPALRARGVNLVAFSMSFAVGPARFCIVVELLAVLDGGGSELLTSVPDWRETSIMRSRRSTAHSASSGALVSKSIHVSSADLTLPF